MIVLSSGAWAMGSSLAKCFRQGPLLSIVFQWHECVCESKRREIDSLVDGDRLTIGVSCWLSRPRQARDDKLEYDKVRSVSW